MAIRADEGADPLVVDLRLRFAPSFRQRKVASRPQFREAFSIGIDV